MLHAKAPPPPPDQSMNRASGRWLDLCGPIGKLGACIIGGDIAGRNAARGGSTPWT
jgi:hypothetical protein